MDVYFKSNQSKVVLFKMLAPLVFVFIVSSLTFATVDAENDASSPCQGGNCELPPYPINGIYIVNNNPAAVPGERYPSVKLEISCNSGFQVENNINSTFCVNGDWSSIMPKCVRFCRLEKHPNVEYRCMLTGPGSISGSRECGSLEPSGTVAKPICKYPHYYSSELLTDMRCVEGTWDYIATCKPVSSLTFATVDAENDTSSPSQGDNCKLPPYPRNGMYIVNNNPAAVPGERYPDVLLEISCNAGFQIENNINSTLCVNGNWSSIMPKCVRFCKLQKHPSVKYRCVLSGLGSFTGSRECGSLEPSGTAATPICRTPNYYSSELLPNMRCVEGSWDYIATCKPECGVITPEGTQLVIGSGGKTAKRGELPWHAGVYSRLYSPYMQICGGSLISTNTVISAAHCFWSDANQLLPAAQFAVGVGKLYRPYNEDHDADAQKSDVADIIIPTRFRGSATNFQDDIALVVVKTPFTYEVFIRPVCLNFDVNIDRNQLTDGNMGKVAGWGLTEKNGKVSQVLKVVNLPYVKIEDCYAISPPTFWAYITSDKICAGYTNGTALCQGDSGGGLAFPAYEYSTERYYLRGVASTASRNDDLCNTHTLTTFTSISKHEHFIKQYL